MTSSSKSALGRPPCSNLEACEEGGGMCLEDGELQEEEHGARGGKLNSMEFRGFRIGKFRTDKIRNGQGKGGRYIHTTIQVVLGPTMKTQIMGESRFNHEKQNYGGKL